MKAVVFLGLLAVGGLCAPLGEQIAEQIDEAAAAADPADDNAMRVKRAKEAIMFGNQQNDAKEIKKREDPKLDSNILDNGASVIVKEPVEIEQAPVDEDLPIEPVEMDEETVIEEPAMEKEEEDTMVNETPDETEVQTVDDKDMEDGYLADVDYGKYQKYLKDIQNSKYDLSQYLLGPANYMMNRYGDYVPYNGMRYRRSQNRRFNGGDYLRSSRHLKRSHRTKRDLYYPIDALSQDYLPLDESYYNRPYNNYPLEDLLDALRSDAYEEDDTDDDVSYFPYETYVDEEDDDDYLPPLYEVPLKRQAGLSYVPGFKRSRDFYPYFMEPGTHFQAFVPQKRSLSLEDYADAYQKVMELAAALRERNYYPREYELEYKKK